MALLYYFYSTCVSVEDLCRGRPLCENKAGIKWCRSAPIATEAHWKDNPGHYSVKCAFSNQTYERSPNGQWITTWKKSGKDTFHCANRADKDPFVETKNDSNETTWLQWSSKECPEDQLRCVGRDSAEKCVKRFRKFYRPVYLLLAVLLKT